MVTEIDYDDVRYEDSVSSDYHFQPDALDGIRQMESQPRSRFSIWIYSYSDLAVYVREWLIESSTNELVNEMRRTMPHWIDFVRQITNLIDEGDHPAYGEDWTIFLGGLRLRDILARLIETEITKSIDYGLDCSLPEPECLCNCPACRRFITERISVNAKIPDVRI